LEGAEAAQEREDGGHEGGRHTQKVYQLFSCSYNHQNIVLLNEGRSAQILWAWLLTGLDSFHVGKLCPGEHVPRFCETLTSANIWLQQRGASQGSARAAGIAAASCVALEGKMLLVV